MVGLSLLYSLKLTRNKEGWNIRQYKRAGQLYLIGMTFLYFNTAFKFPWMFIGHGILLSIASAILLRPPIASKDRSLHHAGASLGNSVLSQCGEHQIRFINAGNGPFLPHVLFGVFGVICAHTLLEGSKRHKQIFVGTMILFAAISFAHSPSGSFLIIQTRPCIQTPKTIHPLDVVITRPHTILQEMVPNKYMRFLPEAHSKKEFESITTTPPPVFPS